MLLPQCTLILDGAGLDTAAQSHMDGGHRKVHAGVHSTTGVYHVKLGAAPDNSTRLARRLDAAAADPLVGVHSAPPKTAVSADGAGKCTRTLSGPTPPLTLLTDDASDEQHQVPAVPPRAVSAGECCPPPSLFYAVYTHTPTVQYHCIT